MKSIKVTFHELNDADIIAFLEPFIEAGESGQLLIKRKLRELIVTHRLIAMHGSGVPMSHIAPKTPEKPQKNKNFDLDDGFDLDALSAELDATG